VDGSGHEDRDRGSSVEKATTAGVRTPTSCARASYLEYGLNRLTTRCPRPLPGPFAISAFLAALAAAPMRVGVGANCLARWGVGRLNRG
jgi:hypothetical protein